MADDKHISKIARDTAKRADKTFQTAEEFCGRLKEEYQKALEDIQRNVADFYMRYAAENGMTYAEAVKYLSKVELKKYRNTLEKFKDIVDIKDEALMAELNILAAKEKVTRLESLMASIKTELARLESVTESSLEKHLKDTFKESYTGAAAGLKDIVEVKTSFSMINPTLIEETIRFPWSGQNFSEILWNDTNKLTRELKSELVQGFIKGTSAHKMSSNLAKRMGNSYANAQRVVMTETAHVLNKASLMSYADNGVEKVEFLAVLDGRTSSICFNLNGDEIPIEIAVPGKNIPPLHPHCRSTIIPVVDDIE